MSHGRAAELLVLGQSVLLAVVFCAAARSAVAQYVAYVGNSGLDSFLAASLSVIDLTTKDTLATIPLPVFPLNSNFDPGPLITSADGTLLYILQEAQESGVLLTMDVRTRAIVHAVRLPRGVEGWHVAVSPDGQLAYLPRHTRTGSAVSLLSLHKGEIVGEVPVDGVTNVVLTLDGKSLYANGSAGVTVIDTASRAIATTLPVFAYDPMTLSPDGQMVYAECRLPGDALGVVSRLCAIATATNEVTIVAPSMPIIISALRVDGDRVYAAYQKSFGNIPGAVLVIDTNTGAIVADIPVGNNPVAIATTTDTVYVVNVSSATISAIDVTTNSVTHTLVPGVRPISIAIGRVLPEQTITTPTSTAAPTGTPTPVACLGDCNGDGQVSVNEIIIAVNIVLGSAQASACPAIQCNLPSGLPDIICIQQAVTDALYGCPTWYEGCGPLVLRDDPCPSTVTFCTTEQLGARCSPAGVTCCEAGSMCTNIGGTASCNAPLVCTNLPPTYCPIWIGDLRHR